MTIPNFSPQVYLGVLIAIILGVLSWTTYHYHSLYEIKSTEYDLVSAKNAELLANIKDDGKAIDKLVKDTSDREEASKRALANAEKKFQDYVKHSQGVMIATPSDPNMCISADNLFNQYIGGK